jgi:hypothetical protein
VSGAKMAAADAIRNHATPSTPTAGKSKIFDRPCGRSAPLRQPRLYDSQR